jgi:hypothetical protein
MTLTTFGSPDSRDEGGSGDTTDSSIPRSLDEGCFEKRVGADLDEVEESNQQTFGSPEPGSTF